jgi:hypothetical protein
MTVEWNDDGHTVSLSLEDRVLRARVVCPHDEAALGAMNLDRLPACRVEKDEPGNLVQLPQCAVEAAAIEYSNEELWDEGTQDFAVTVSPFPVLWGRDTEGEVYVTRKADG